MGDTIAGEFSVTMTQGDRETPLYEYEMRSVINRKRLEKEMREY